jgi:queuosine precursor transporter
MLHTTLKSLAAFIIPHVPTLPRSGAVYALLAIIFCSSLVVANLIGGVLIPIDLPVFGHRMVSAGIFIFPFTFMVTDVLNEFYGTAGARLLTLLGFCMAVFFYGIFSGLLQLPIAPNSPISAASFMQMASSFNGMIVASLTAYLLGQFLDIGLFAFFKKWTGERFIWLRATGSTLVSQGFDSFVVTFIAFYGQMPLEQMLLIGHSNYEIKVLVAFIITPMLYLIHAVVRRLLKTGS